MPFSNQQIFLVFTQQNSKFFPGITMHKVVEKIIFLLRTIHIIS